MTPIFKTGDLLHIPQATRLWRTTGGDVKFWRPDRPKTGLYISPHDSESSCQDPGLDRRMVYVDGHYWYIRARDIFIYTTDKQESANVG